MADAILTNGTKFEIVKGEGSDIEVGAITSIGEVGFGEAEEIEVTSLNEADGYAYEKSHLILMGEYVMFRKVWVYIILICLVFTGCSTKKQNEGELHHPYIKFDPENCMGAVHDPSLIVEDKAYTLSEYTIGNEYSKNIVYYNQDAECSLFMARYNNSAGYEFLMTENTTEKEYGQIIYEIFKDIQAELGEPKELVIELDGSKSDSIDAMNGEYERIDTFSARWNIDKHEILSLYVMKYEIPNRFRKSIIVSFYKQIN